MVVDSGRSVEWRVPLKNPIRTPGDCESTMRVGVPDEYVRTTYTIGSSTPEIVINDTVHISLRKWLPSG